MISLVVVRLMMSKNHFFDSKVAMKFIIKDADFTFEQPTPPLERRLRQIKQIIHSQKDHEYKYNKIFKKLSEVISFDNIHLFNHKEDIEEGAFAQKYLWDANVGKLVSNLEDTSHVPYAPYFERWRALLSSGTIIQNAIDNLPELEQEYLNEHGARFVVILPVFFNYKFTGFVQINFKEVHRLFSENELNILQDLFESLYWAENIQVTMRELQTQIEFTKQAHAQKENTLSNITHELQTPMNGIIGLTEQLDLLENDLTKKTYLESIKLSLSNLMTVVNNILDTSSDDQKKYDLVDIQYNLKETAQNLLDVHRESAEEKGLQFIAEFDEDFPDKITGDSRRVNQIISNLLDNAIKFTHEGSVHIYFNSMLKSGNRLIFIEVADTGIGIAPENQEVIFDKFVQLESADNRAFSGIGAGLTIVKDLVKAMRGNVKVQSSLGSGSVFTVTIPTIPVVRKVGNLKDQAEELAKMRFLVVDDNEINLKVVTAILKKWGSEYDVALNGEEAIDKAKNNDYDIIFMDIQMPVMDGFEATRQIRKLKGLKPRILALTASILRENEYKCIQAGMDGVIRKPFFPDNLINWIVNKKEEHKSEGSLSTPETTEMDEINYEVINMQYLEDIASGNKEFIQEMIQLFFEQVPQKLDEMEKGLNKNDYDGIAATAHKLKPIVGYVGLDPQSIGLKDIENEARKSGDINSMKKNYENVSESLNLAMKELKIYLKSI